LSEIPLTIIHFLFKLGIYFAVLVYFKVLGEKIEDKSKISVSWNVLFIPIYVFYFFTIIYFILETFAYENSVCSKIKRLISCSIFLSGFILSSILFCMKIDENIELNTSLVIPGIVSFSSIYYMIHSHCIFKNNNY
jgi:hypothetical protein